MNGIIVLLMFVMLAVSQNHGLRSTRFDFEDFLGKAYVITTKQTIPPQVRDVALRLGFQPIHLAAVLPYQQLYPTKQSFCQSCFFTSPPGGTVPESELTMGQLSLTCSTKKVMEIIAADVELENDDWSLILEDDVRLHPNVSAPRLEVSEGMRIYREENQSYGFIYLGLCGGGCVRFSPRKSSIGIGM